MWFNIVEPHFRLEYTPVNGYSMVQIDGPDFRIFQYKESLKLFENKELRNLGATLFYSGK